MTAFLLGAHLDNVAQPPQSSYDRLRLMRAEAAVALHTPETHHGSGVYRALRDLGVRRVCVRVGDEQLVAPADWLRWANAAYAAVRGVFPDDAIDVQVLNEVNLSDAAPEALAAFLAAVRAGWSLPCRLLLTPLSMGRLGWQDYLARLLAAFGSDLPFDAVAVHPYAGNASQIGPFLTIGKPVVVTEFSHPGLSGAARAAWSLAQCQGWASQGVESACQFIVDGAPFGAWDPTYRMTDDEARALGARPPIEVAAPRRKTGVRLGLMVRMQADIPEKTVAAAAALCARGGFRAWCPKCADGDALEGTFDERGELAVVELADVDRLVAAFRAHAIAVEPWVVYRGIAPADEATLHAEIAARTGVLLVDFEWRYAGFADHGTWDDFVSYCRRLRQGAGNAKLVLCPDPRQERRGDFPLAEVAPFFDAVADQCYWTDFGTSARAELAQDLGMNHAGLAQCPVVPANALAADLDDGLTLIEEQWVGTGEPTVYVFQRASLADANLPVFAKHAAREEDPMPPLNVDTARYEAAYWGPSYALLADAQQLAARGQAIVAQLRATGHHADALLADAVEKAAAEITGAADALRPAVSLHKIICGAEAA
jgi:hypothetical protein